MSEYIILYGDTGQATRETMKLLRESGIEFVFTLDENASMLPTLSTSTGSISGLERIRQFVVKRGGLQVNIDVASSAVRHHCLRSCFRSGCP